MCAFFCTTLTTFHFDNLLTWCFLPTKINTYIDGFRNFGFYYLFHVFIFTLKWKTSYFFWFINLVAYNFPNFLQKILQKFFLFFSLGKLFLCFLTLFSWLVTRMKKTCISEFLQLYKKDLNVITCIKLNFVNHLFVFVEIENVYFML